MSDDKINIDDAKDKPELLEQAKKGLETAAATAATDKEAAQLTDGSDKGQRSIDEVVAKSQQDLIKVKNIINQGGFTGPEKDKYTISLHHAEWIYARNLYRKCDYNVIDKSTRYTNLVNKKANNNEIVKAHKEWVDVRNNCRQSSSDLITKANQYIETDRRVRTNKNGEGNIYPVIQQAQGFQVQRNGYTNQVEGFVMGKEDIQEGFDFATPAQIPETNTNDKFNARLPLYSDSGTVRTTDTNKTILPWNQYYTDCDTMGPGSTEADRGKCRNANTIIDTYVRKINSEFDRSDLLLNTYYTIITGGGGGGGGGITRGASTRVGQSASPNLTLLEQRDIQSIMENQKKNIDLYKQNALYDYDEYNSLAFYEDLVNFIYYAVFILFAFISLRGLFKGGNLDYRIIGSVILLGMYPKYILQVVLWIFDLIAKILELLGLKNVRFWH